MIRSADEAPGDMRDWSTREAQCASAAPSEPDVHAAEDKAPPGHPLEPLLQQIASVRAAAIHYVESQKDLTAAAIRRWLVKVLIAGVVAIVGVTALVACTVMFASALADAIGLAAGGRPWLGKLIVGGGLLVATAIAAAIYCSNWLRWARAKTIHKYESRRDAQRH